MRLNNSKVLNELYQFNYKDINMSAVNLDLTEFINGLDNWSGMYYYDGYLYILDAHTTGINYKVNLETKEISQLSYTFNSDIIENGYYEMPGFCENHVLVIETLDYESYYAHILTLGEDIIDTPINIISDKGYDINDLYPDNIVTDADNKDIIYCSTLMYDDNDNQVLNDILYKIDVKNGIMESMHMDIEEPVKKISGDFNFAYFSHDRLKVVYNIDKYIIFYEYSEALNKFYEVDRIIGSYDIFNCTHYIDNHIMIDYRLNEYIGVLIYDLHTHEKYLTPRLVNNILSVSFASSKLLVDGVTDGHLYYLNKVELSKSELFSGNYNDLENKPCYDTRITERKNYTYTYSVSNIPENGFIKVSDDTYTIEEIKNFSNVTITFDYMDDTASETYNCLMLSESDYSLFFFPDQSGNKNTACICNGIVYILLKDTGNMSAGTYFKAQADSDCIIEFSFDYLLSGEIKVLDEKYLANKPGRIVYTPNPDGSGNMLRGEIFNSCLNRAGAFSHAEGINTNAMGASAHSEGFYTEANGTYSHAEGCGTIANGHSQHAQGSYNAPLGDSYAHIVGNGSSDTNRKNAHTLDWNGNAWFAGKATVSAQPTDNNDLTTKKYVDDIAANKVDVVEGKALVNMGEIARLSKVDNYNDAEVRGLIEDLSESKADATSIPTKVSQLTNDSGFLTAVPATYATQAYVADAINKAQLDGSDSEIDLSPYALTSDLALKADKTELHTHENQTLLNSITEKHLTSMAEISDTLNGPRNYYNAEAITDGVYLNSNGLIYENSIYFTTDYIPIAPGQTLYFYGANGRYDVQINARFVGFFDIDKHFIAGSVVSYVNQITNTHETGAYIRITVQHGGWGLGYVENIYPGVDIKYGEIPESKLWEKPQKIDVFLPNDIYCAVGTTIELYNNQVCLQADKLHLNWCCDYGHAMKRKFSFEGTSALAGQIIPVTLEIYNDYNVLKYTKTIQIHVVAATITNPITCVPIGDSWTNQKPWPGEVINLSGEKVSFVGKFTATVKDANGNWREYNHEGRSGFSAYDYDGAHAYTFGNAGEDTHHAFYNPTTARFDWNNYVNTVLGGTQPGAVILQMGINGIAADNTGMVGHEVNMINLIRQDNADIPIFVTLPAYKGNQDGLGVQESSDGHAYHRGVYDYLEKQKVMNYSSLLYEACKDMVGVYFIPLNICFDSEYNYGAQEVPVNPRATSIIEKIPMEAVHPQDYGYYQMADIVYSVMCGNLS